MEDWGNTCEETIHAVAACRSAPPHKIEAGNFYGKCCYFCFTINVGLHIIECIIHNRMKRAARLVADDKRAGEA